MCNECPINDFRGDSLSPQVSHNSMVLFLYRFLLTDEDNLSLSLRKACCIEQTVLIFMVIYV